MCRQNSMQVNSNWDPLAILTAAECGSSLVEKRKKTKQNLSALLKKHTHFKRTSFLITFVELSQSFQTSLKKNVHLESHAAIFWFKTRLESSLKFGSKSAGMNPIGPPPPRRRITGRRNERLEEEAGTRAVKAKAVAVKAATAVAKASAAAVAKGAAPNAAVIVKAKPPAPPPPVGAGAPFVVPAAVKAKPPPPPVGAKAANPALAVPVPTDQQTVVDGAATFQADGDPIVGDGPVSCSAFTRLFFWGQQDSHPCYHGSPIWNMPAPDDCRLRHTDQPRNHQLGRGGNSGINLEEWRAAWGVGVYGDDVPGSGNSQPI